MQYIYNEDIMGPGGSTSILSHTASAWGRFLRKPVRALVVGSLAGSFVGCRPEVRNCFPLECGTKGSCIGGRCVQHEGRQAIDVSRRVLLDPDEILWVSPAAPEGSLPDRIAFGSKETAGGRLYLRFTPRLLSDQRVLEANLLMSRDLSMGTDSTPVVLRSLAITSDWDSRTLSWSHQPFLTSAGTARISVGQDHVQWVRLPLLPIVARWRAHGSPAVALAIAAEGESDSGVAIVLANSPQTGELAGPRLELYVR